jgi:hypothetical protein
MPSIRYNDKAVKDAKKYREDDSIDCVLAPPPSSPSGLEDAPFSPSKLQYICSLVYSPTVNNPCASFKIPK